MTVSEIYDVAVIGYGPGGEVATATLGARGHHVIAIERYANPYPLPRAVTFDGEACRTIQATGADMTHALRNSTVLSSAPFVDVAGNTLFAQDWSGTLCGYAARRSIFQPDIEASLHDRISSLPNVDVLRGFQVDSFAQDENGVQLEMAGPDGERRFIRARYVIGADGTNSFLRSALGVPVYRSGFSTALMNFDMEVLRPLPPRFSGFRTIMDPERPHMFMPIGTKRMRFEIFVIPGDREEDLLQEHVVWNWLEAKHGLGRDDLKLSRQVIYHFGSSVCERWRVGRAFLLGDAAHSMSPALGQGANSSFRDARNLSWKLAMVLEGNADASLLDTYEAELKPFVSQLVAQSERISRVALVTDAGEAEKRDRGVQSADEVEAKAWLWPTMQGGLYAAIGHSDSAPVIVGRLAPQGRISRGGRIGMADDILGSGFQLITRHTLFLTDSRRSLLETIGGAIAVVGATEHDDGIDDLDGVYSEFLDRNGIDFYLMRPDFYVLCAGMAEDAGVLLDRLGEMLVAKGGVQRGGSPSSMASEVAA